MTAPRTPYAPSIDDLKTLGSGLPAGVQPERIRFMRNQEVSAKKQRDTFRSRIVAAYARANSLFDTCLARSQTTAAVDDPGTGGKRGDRDLFCKATSPSKPNQVISRLCLRTLGIQSSPAAARWNVLSTTHINHPAPQIAAETTRPYWLWDQTVARNCKSARHSRNS